MAKSCTLAWCFFQLQKKPLSLLSAFLGLLCELVVVCHLPSVLACIVVLSESWKTLIYRVPHLFGENLTAIFCRRHFLNAISKGKAINFRAFIFLDLTFQDLLRLLAWLGSETSSTDFCVTLYIAVTGNTNSPFWHFSSHDAFNGL